MKNQKFTLENTTVRTFKGLNGFIIYKGKGYGSQIAEAATMEEARLFDKELHNIVYRPITQLSTGQKGGAYFYKNTDTMFFKNHPFYNDFKIN